MVSKTKVTVAIPTYNRSDLLKVSLESVLNQDYPDFQVLILDNASTDNTEAIVRSFDDPRIIYVRHSTNIGLLNNWNKAIELSNSSYLTILSDDDVLLPGFIDEFAKAFDEHPCVGLVAAPAKFIDQHSAPLQVIDRERSDEFPIGILSGIEYLHQIVSGRKWILRTSAVMFRIDALSVIGSIDAPHAVEICDLNLFLRIAAQFDFFFLSNELAQVRFHSEQCSMDSFHAAGGTGPLAVMAEKTDAIAYLLQSSRAADANYRQWLAERLLHISLCRSELTTQHIPKLNLSWSERLQIALQQITNIVPPQKQFILVDENQWGCEKRSDFQALPFLEQEGQYWGAPQDSQTAIRELERMRYQGASFLVIGWTAFWWFDYFAEFRSYLNTKFPCTLKNSCLMVFDLEHPLHS
ncbi:glycosyltransferase family 2 protein [Leptolyngbya sp. FACHB-17]|uniref:glycosyltransferase family 2 protein n=1 Tax=unclassified Leptolyngbya TaxID=2650499 RepID=UPI0016808158|nr:glycosyltransferase family 2 protein [Leptolyngbya sp. FACHB-17]MBD2079350.1 glycosyltransferase family 2 protein [Leptolyngbya sp. FACHB-17]